MQKNVNKTNTSSVLGMVNVPDEIIRNGIIQSQFITNIQMFPIFKDVMVLSIVPITQTKTTVNVVMEIYRLFHVIQNVNYTPQNRILI